MKLASLLCSLLILTAISGCTSEKDADDHKPAMFIQQPVEGAQLNTADEFHIELHVSDDIGLDHCVVSLNYAEQHKSDAHDDEPWTYNETFMCSGKKEFTIHEHLIIPDTIGHAPTSHGLYQFKATCIDMAGNQITDIIHFSIK